MRCLSQKVGWKKEKKKTFSSLSWERIVFRPWRKWVKKNLFLSMHSKREKKVSPRVQSQKGRRKKGIFPYNAEKKFLLRTNFRKSGVPTNIFWYPGDFHGRFINKRGKGKGERKKKESLIEIIPVAFPSVRFGPSWLSPISRLRTTRCFPILYFFPVWQQKRREERDRWCGGRSCPLRGHPRTQ